MVAVARLALLLLGCMGLLRPADYCPKGWSYYKLSCFRYFRQLRSWDEAERQCQASHASCPQGAGMEETWAQMWVGMAGVGTGDSPGADGSTGVQGL
uniref:Uncharacterized protein n=1 Tax=Bubo bubo TaxID=30461 RepID=A0A8C0FBD1_BUBBB